VRDGRVVEVDQRLRHEGEPVLDAAGAFVAPGFLETHTHLDPAMFWDPSGDPLPQHGVTSALFGNCGLSLAPVRAEAVAGVTALFCYVEDLPEAAFDTAIPWDWESYPDYLDAMSRDGYALNVSGLVGHSVLRLYVLGEEAWDRPSTADEIERIAALLDAALAAGAFGLSSSLGFDEDRQKRPVPSRLADDAELRRVFEVLAARGRILEFIPNTVPKYMTRDVRRVADLSRGLDLTQTWINIFLDEQRPDIATSLLDFAAGLQAEGFKSYPQVSPRTLDIQVNWNGGMSFYTLAKGWHRVLQADPAEKARLLADPEWRAVARDEWDAMPFTMIQHHRPGNIRLISVTRPELEPWVGRSFAELVAARGGHPSDVLADWVLENDLEPGIVGVGIANGDPEGVAGILRHPAALVSNSDAGAHLQMMCAVGDTTLLLTRHVRERGDFTVEEAVCHLTARPAAIFGYHDRGVIAPGAIADLTVFALDELSWDTDSFVHDMPAGGARLRRPPGGFRYTLVSGVVTQEHGALTGARPGSMLRAGSSPYTNSG
jgi:N-acyl-D-aspartate/D-glutamate deacylase